ncbi:hypothetical protein [Moorena producens]|uniref:hypothetical protein n=1 Tax=Moorena producens TaxID=1155739 RepID=UPI003C713C2D
MTKKQNFSAFISVSTLMDIVEKQTIYTVELSYDDIIEQLMNKNTYDRSLNTEELTKEFLSGKPDDDHKLLSINLSFSQEYLKFLIDNKKSYKNIVKWKDILLLVLRPDYYSLPDPPNYSNNKNIDKNKDVENSDKNKDVENSDKT